MKHKNKSRRDFLSKITVGAGILPLTLLDENPTVQVAKKKVVCVGGHPDDPESGCGGTLAKLAKQGYDVTIVYLTTGEAGIAGKSHAEAAAVRKAEAIKGSKVLNAKPVFAGQIDGDTVVNNEWIRKLHDIISAEKPDIVFTHWPIDSHKDHQAASLLTIQAWMNSGKSFQLFFFEVLTGIQTAVFSPTDYVDISDTQEQKRQSVYCHTSQNPDAIYSEGHAEMEATRGKEIGSRAAEGFIRANGKGGTMMGF
ncbi:PIG-L deacetylase family protein [Chryseolinea sp. T2]|uniref:PIG-L deacetylase family protein n=1 Tax=Chryseolinea sp. T2 TaxID=3129255 RepID=UPI003076DF65